MARRRIEGWRTAATAGVAYLLTAFATVSLTRFEGGVAYLWLAGAVMIAALMNAPRAHWPAITVACGLASVAVTSTVGVGPVAAVPLAVVNVTESLLAILLLDRLGLRRDSLDSVRRLGALVLAVGIAAPLATAAPGAGLIAWATGTGFAGNLAGWCAAHALGNMTGVPVFGFLAMGAFGRWFDAASPQRLAEAGALLALVLATTTLVFAQTAMPLLFLPILPVMLATFRMGRLGAAAGVLIIAGVGGWLTAQGLGPINLVHAEPGVRAQMFQFYLAMTVLTALPVAAELRHRSRLFDQLRESEARYRLLADNSTDIVMSLTVDGAIRYASPSITQLGGYTPESVAGMKGVRLVLRPYREAVTRAHLEALADPDRTQIIEYEALTSSGELRWFESHMRAVRNERGQPAGVVSAIRDIGHRKAIEGELSRAAGTDPLTGLANRRAFDAALDRLLAGGAGGGCVAVLDLDFFKRVNDRYGHHAGDRVLVAFADIARGAVREGDLVARLGGEEFGLLLPGADPDRARRICERVRSVVAETGVPVGETVVRVTASIGLAVPVAGATRAEVLRAADEALYQAKADGRDRLRLAA